jgi:DUF4097 and DUF4098 domain-containing protein YvlB
MNRFLYVLSAAMLLALAYPADAQQRTRRASHDTERDDVRAMDTTVAFARGGTVSLTIRGGEVVVTGWDKDEVRVRTRTEDGAVRFGATSTRVTVELDGYRRGSDAHFEINVPQGTRVSARSQTGEITIRGTKGQVEAGTQSGEIVIADVTGRVDVNTLSGDIDISSADGDAEIKTVSGDVKIDKMKGDVEVETVSGDIVIEGAVSRFVRVRTTGGDVSYDGTIDAQGRYELASHSGDIRRADQRVHLERQRRERLPHDAQAR